MCEPGSNGGGPVWLESTICWGSMEMENICCHLYTNYTRIEDNSRLPPNRTWTQIIAKCFINPWKIHLRTWMEFEQDPTTIWTWPEQDPNRTQAGPGHHTDSTQTVPGQDRNRPRTGPKQDPDRPQTGPDQYLNRTQSAPNQHPNRTHSGPQWKTSRVNCKSQLPARGFPNI